MNINRGRALGVLIVALTVGAWTIATHPLTLTSESRLWVDGTSTIKSFSCKAAVVDATIETLVDNPVAALLGGANVVKTLAFTVPADKLDCGNGTMNGHMLKAIKAKDHPVIAFSLDTYAITTAADSSTVTLRGTLTLGGVAKPVVMDARLSSVPDGALRVAGMYEINMKDYELKPPSLMLGTMMVREKVKVNFNLVLR